MYHHNLDGEISTFIEVKKVDGSARYYAVIGDQNYEIDQASYLANVGER